MNGRRIGTGLAAGLAALVLSACFGGGDDDAAPRYGRLVVFGDSLSDVGTYAPATSLTGDGAPPYFGGKFTTNGAAGTIWVENLAGVLGVEVTPAEVGFDGSSVRCPAAATPALAGSCTAYGQGGARVTDPNGLGRNADGSGALTVPVVTQVANHLARFTAFKDTDLVIVYAGNNDVFIQFEAFAVAAGTAQAQAAAGLLTPTEALAVPRRRTLALAVGITISIMAIPALAFVLRVTHLFDKFLT